MFSTLYNNTFENVINCAVKALNIDNLKMCGFIFFNNTTRIFLSQVLFFYKSFISNNI